MLSAVDPTHGHVLCAGIAVILEVPRARVLRDAQVEPITKAARTLVRGRKSVQFCISPCSDVFRCSRKVRAGPTPTAEAEASLRLSRRESSASAFEHPWRYMWDKNLVRKLLQPSPDARRPPRHRHAQHDAGVGGRSSPVKTSQGDRETKRERAFWIGRSRGGATIWLEGGRHRHRSEDRRGC